MAWVYLASSTLIVAKMPQTIGIGAVSVINDAKSNFSRYMHTWLRLLSNKKKDKWMKKGKMGKKN